MKRLIDVQINGCDFDLMDDLMNVNVLVIGK